MNKNKIILILAVILALMPFLGFPSSWKDFFYVITGLLIIMLSLMKKRTELKKNSSEISTEEFGVKNDRPIQ